MFIYVDLYTHIFKMYTWYIKTLETFAKITYKWCKNIAKSTFMCLESTFAV